ncbi:hypothetical protein SDC9_124449 [bioreactor metagenome]|uniref:Uncharacterized protein n=1 Tax=bioreactor metagenome TaxID=1076179 RepID=A0A645CKF4_9ZZZZ
MNPVYRKVENGMLQVMNMIIGVNRLLGMPIVLNTCAIGMITICPGMTKPDMNRM